MTCKTCKGSRLITSIAGIIRCPDCQSSAQPAGSMDIPSERSLDAAKKLASKWWKEKKLSYNWNKDDDVWFLATVIENKKVP